MPDITLDDLVRNGTMSPEIAATLATAGAERRSFLTIAIPRLAGKTTVMRAVLAHAPGGTPLHQLSEATPDLGIPSDDPGAAGGYLMMSEIAPVGFAEYLWGAPVRRVFAAIERGFALATALHANGVEQAFDVICRENAVPDAHAAQLRLAIYIRVFSTDGRTIAARRVVAVHEIDGVEAGVPRTRLLHRWHEPTDTFEQVEAPRILAQDTPAYAARLEGFRAALEG